MEVPRLQSLWAKFEGHGIQFVGVDAGANEAAAKTWLAGMSVTFPVIMDPYNTIFTSYQVSSYPRTFIIGRDMVIWKDVVGADTESVTEGHLMDVVYRRDPIDLELVMDVSDTMNDLSPSDPGGDPKLIMMKKAATIISELLYAHGQGDDRMGLTWFTDDASEYQTPLGQRLLPVQLNAANLKAEINVHGTGTCTAMGAGLQTAFNTLSSSTQHRFIILCTDGMQNIEPKVEKVGNHFEIINSGGWLCGGHSSVPAYPGVDIASYNARIHTIGIGITAEYASLLQEVADATKGFYRATNDPENDLDLIYCLDLCNCMAGGSPQVVLHSTGRLPVAECRAEERFNLNRTARKMTVTLSWKKSLQGGLTFWLYAPDGTLLDLHHEMQMSETYATATIFLPNQQDGKTLQHVGLWRIVVAGQFTGEYVDYHATVIAEDREVMHKLDYPRRRYAVGDLLPLRIQLTEREQPITRVNEIVMETAYLRVPLPELLAQYEVSMYELLSKTQSRAREPLRDPLILKLEAMATDQRFRERMKPVRKQLSLREGSLKPEFKTNEILIPVELTQTGLHTFKVIVTAETLESGPIQRVDLVSVIVDPGEVDPKQTTVTPLEISAGERTGVLVRVTLKNSQGQLLGPGRASEIGAAIGGQALGTQVEDLLDGTYQVQLLLAEREWAEIRDKHARVNITFQSRVIWEEAI